MFPVSIKPCEMMGLDVKKPKCLFHKDIIVMQWNTFWGRRLKYILQAVLSKHNYIWKTTYATKRQNSQILL